jgi:hypothetical protein
VPCVPCGIGTAIRRRAGGGSIRVYLRAASAAPKASGEAKVEAKKGITNIEASVRALGWPSKLGTEFLTHVLWDVPPEGSSSKVRDIKANNY